ncbi:MAG TPA: class I SAM-dependent methyltransferase, partial [Cyclobacteriaceae bacterium]|nr:class I SAM-dependent methyltransferase [Cyclobacteriaceae bacterium]
MNKDEVRLRYENWHTEMAAQEKDIFCLPWYQTVIKLLPDLNGMNVIEVGCGRGVFANYLANTYPKARITAIDFSENAIAVARSNYTTVSNLEFEVGDAEHLSHKFFDKFDFYISCETLEHVESPKKMIGEIQRVLKRDGRFILTTENYLNAYILIWLKCWLLKRPFDSGSGIQPN